MNQLQANVGAGEVPTLFSPPNIEVAISELEGELGDNEPALFEGNF